MVSTEESGMEAGRTFRRMKSRECMEKWEEHSVFRDCRALWLLVFGVSEDIKLERWPGRASSQARAGDSVLCAV